MASSRSTGFPGPLDADETPKPMGPPEGIDFAAIKARLAKKVSTPNQMVRYPFVNQSMGQGPGFDEIPPGPRPMMAFTIPNTRFKCPVGIDANIGPSTSGVDKENTIKQFPVDIDHGSRGTYQKTKKRGRKRKNSQESAKSGKEQVDNPPDEDRGRWNVGTPDEDRRRGNVDSLDMTPADDGRMRKDDHETGLKRKIDRKSNVPKRKKGNPQAKTETIDEDSTEDLEYDAESLKLMDEVSQGSKYHQLDLLKQIGIKDNFDNREFHPWMCYICNVDGENWKGYVHHCRSMRHKREVVNLGTTLMKDFRLHLVNNIKALRFNRITFALGQSSIEKKNLDIPSSKDKDLSLHGIKECKPGMHECRPCGKYFNGTIRFSQIQNHLKAETHKKREQYLKLRFGQSWLDYHWYNQSNRHERGDKEPKGVAFVLPVSGFFCKLCSKFYNNEISAKDVHCRTISHLTKVKDWDHDQLSKKKKVSLDVSKEDIEGAVKEKGRTKKTDILCTIVIDSDDEDLSDRRDDERHSRSKQRNTDGGQNSAKEELEEGELSERDMQLMAKQQHENRIREEYDKREAEKKQQKQQSEMLWQQREWENKERESKQIEKRLREERDAAERKAQEMEMLAKETELKSKLEKEKRELGERETLLQAQIKREAKKKKKEEQLEKEKERLEKESLKKERLENERSEQDEKELVREKLEKERIENEQKEKEEAEAREKELEVLWLKQQEGQTLREQQLAKLEMRFKEQEKREKELLGEKLYLEMLAKNINPVSIKDDNREATVQEHMSRKQLDENVRLESMRQKEQQRIRHISGQDVPMDKETSGIQEKERELREIVAREEEWRRIDEKERELIELEVRQQHEMQERRKMQLLREQELNAIRNEGTVEESVLFRKQVDVWFIKETQPVSQGIGGVDTNQQLSQEIGGLGTPSQRVLQGIGGTGTTQQHVQQGIVTIQQQVPQGISGMRTIQQQTTQGIGGMGTPQQQAIQEIGGMGIPQQQVPQGIGGMGTLQQQATQGIGGMGTHQQAIQGIGGMETIQQQGIGGMGTPHQQAMQGIGGMETQQQQILEERFLMQAAQVHAPKTLMSINLEREHIMNELFERGKGEIMIRVMELQRRGFRDNQMQEVMKIEQQKLEEWIIEEMRLRGFDDSHAASGSLEQTTRHDIERAGDESDRVESASGECEMRRTGRSAERDEERRSYDDDESDSQGSYTSDIKAGSAPSPRPQRNRSKRKNTRKRSQGRWDIDPRNRSLRGGQRGRNNRKR